MLQIYYGGTFDPFHRAHLAVACAARDVLGGAVHLVPAADPPHRGRPGASAEQRAAMVVAAIRAETGMDLDRIELERSRQDPGCPSYTVDTLGALRRRWGPRQPLCWVIGGDSLASLTTWHRWQDLFALASIAVVARAGSLLPPVLPESLADTVTGGGWCDDYGALHTQPAGLICQLPMGVRSESSTEVRRRLAAGERVDDLLCPAVEAYIKDHKLYRVDPV